MITAIISITLAFALFVLYLFYTKNNKLNHINHNLEKELIRLKSEKENLQTSIKFADSLGDKFENLSNKIYKDKTKDFEELSTKHIKNILDPLKSKIEDFKKDVDDKYSDEAKERHSLKEEVKNLITTKQSLEEQTQNLVSALRSDVKKQGVWGEIKLEKILEHSGLEKDKEFTLQGKGMALKTSDGSQQLPDAIVNLPEKKHIVIDSKVSLKSYWDFLNNDGEKDNALKALLASVRAHIDDLSEKKYHFNNDLMTPEFVVLFFPLEGALSLIMDMNIPNQNKNLLEYAWDKSVVMVTPSNLMATLKTIASLWKMEKQKQNALQIAEEGGNLYDKFVGFIEDMLKIKKHLTEAKDSFDKAENKLKSGRGNLVNRAEKLKELGAKSTKELPKNF